MIMYLVIITVPLQRMREVYAHAYNELCEHTVETAMADFAAINAFIRILQPHKTSSALCKEKESPSLRSYSSNYNTKTLQTSYYF